MSIDLKELAARESEQTEWKENVADIDDVIKTAVAFSNDFSNLGGGYIVCGARETKDAHGFPRMEIVGLGAARLKELEGKVLSGCRERVEPPIVPVVQELAADTPDRRVLVFIVPATPYAHSFRAHGKDASTYYIRISRETREARNGLLRELLVKKRALEPWDRRANSSATVDDIDLLVLREHLKRMGLWDPARALEDYLSAEIQLAALAPSLCAREPLGGVLRPRNFALLLFGRQPTRFFPGAHAIFSLYPGKDRGEPYAERVVLEGTVVEQANKLISYLNTQAYTIFDKRDMMPNLLKYPQRALQEAVINALAHRDYELDHPVRVTVFSDRVEIFSPGSLPSAVDPERFLRGQATPVWRNQALAYFFNKMQLAQAEGQGIPTILRTMREEGCPPPRFDITSESLICVLPAHPRHELMGEHREIERSLVVGNFQEAARRIEVLLQKDPYNFRSIELFCEANRLMQTPESVYRFVEANKLDPDKLNVPIQLLLAETLNMIKDAGPQVQDYVKQLLAHASNSHLQEEEAKRLVSNLRSVGDHEEAIAVINRTFLSNPGLRTNPFLLRMRGEAHIDLAKRCMETAGNYNSSPNLRRRAWEQCRHYLAEAGRDLRTALEHAGSAVDRDSLNRSLAFHSWLQERARRPPRRRSSGSSGR